MRYEWDDEKNRLNQKKHRISFEMAALAFEDECCLVRPDRVDENRRATMASYWRGSIGPGRLNGTVRRSCLQGGNRWRRNHSHYLGAKG
jgi:hypothetical protein